MTSPKVTIREQDLSTRVPGFQGVYAGIVIPAPKGTTSEPVFITSDVDLLKYFTPNERVEVGYNMAFYSALAYLTKGNRLWVCRADNNSKFGGVIVRKSTSTNIKLTDVEIGGISAVNQVDKEFTLSGDVVNFFRAGDIIRVDNSTGNDGLYTVVSSTLAGTDTAVEVSEAIPSATADGDIFRQTIKNPETIEFQDDDLFLVTGANEGSWANDISIRIFTYANSPDIVKEPDAFLLEVFKQSTGEFLESFVCSRNPNAKDGYGKNIYVEDVIKASNYIRIIDNITELSTVAIKEQTTTIQLDGASDGIAVTDTQMINALNKLANKNEIPLTLVMDGGWTTVAYQQAIDSLCNLRKDCVGILSTPYSTEDSANYITDIVDYRKNDLNLNSSYSALFTPHLKIRDRFNDRDIFVSPDGYAAGAISETSANYEIWYAPAGYRRGIINVMDTKRRFTEGELDLLYDSGINPVKFSAGRGIAIFGQKTLSSRPSALDRLNVRLMLVVIEPAIATFLEDFLFEFNDELTRILVKSGIDSYMEGIRSRKGVYDFLTVCDESNNTPDDIDNNRLNVHLFVQPTKVAEFIQATIVITRTGFDFNLAQGLLI